MAGEKTGVRAAPGLAPCGSHPVVLPSTAPEVGSALSLQKSQNVLDKEEEKKTLIKKMMVRKQLAGLWHQGGEGAEVLSPPTDEVGLGWGGQRTSRHRYLGLGLSSTLNCPPPTLRELGQVTSLL